MCICIGRLHLPISLGAYLYFIITEQDVSIVFCDKCALISQNFQSVVVSKGFSGSGIIEKKSHFTNAPFVNLHLHTFFDHSQVPGIITGILDAWPENRKEDFSNAQFSVDICIIS